MQLEISVKNAAGDTIRRTTRKSALQMLSRGIARPLTEKSIELIEDSGDHRVRAFIRPIYRNGDGFATLEDLEHTPVIQPTKLITGKRPAQPPRDESPVTDREVNPVPFSADEEAAIRAYVGREAARDQRIKLDYEANDGEYWTYSVREVERRNGLNGSGLYDSLLRSGTPHRTGKKYHPRADAQESSACDYSAGPTPIADDYTGAALESPFRGAARDWGTSGFPHGITVFTDGTMWVPTLGLMPCPWASTLSAAS